MFARSRHASGAQVEPQRRLAGSRIVRARSTKFQWEGLKTMKISRRVAALIATLCLTSLAPAATAAAGPPGGITIPKDCHEWNELLGIDNVRSCDDR